ncbi:MAG TPA: translocation/assembly module TamB domain-containing protein [Bryobacteraceae bacterium]|nr:translocation/assembly module TamB domain-containing protein [Bryobacteraceae bacterium]
MRLALALATVILIVVITVVIVVHTSWFQGYAERRLAAYVEHATGGATSIESFQFDVRSLAVTIRGMTIRGKEPEKSSPFFHASLVTLKIGLFSQHRFLVFKQLEIGRPEVTIVTLSNGELNIPTPAKPSRSDFASDTNEIINLAIQHFDINEGQIRFASQAIPLSIHGSDFAAHIAFTSKLEYRGEVTALVNVQYKAPLTARLTIPFVLRRGGIVLNEARLQSPQSNIVVTAELYDLKSPRVSAHVDAHLGVGELRASLAIPVHVDQKAATAVDLQTTFNATRDSVTIQHADLRLGASYLEAAASADTTVFRGSISLDEIRRLFTISKAPAGALNLSGNARLTFPNYFIQGSLSTARLILPDRELGTATFSSSFRIEPNLISLADLHFTAMHTAINGSAAVRDFNTIEANAALQRLTISDAARIVAEKPIAYAGEISASFHAQGPIKTPEVVARVTISPAGSGVPVNGHLSVTYKVETGTIAVPESTIYLPHSTFSLVGEPGIETRLTFQSHDLSDVSPLFRYFSSPGSPALHGGSGALDARARGPLKRSQLSGSIKLTGFIIGGRRFDELSASFAASASGVVIRNASLDSGASRVRFAGSLGLFDWKPEAASAIATDAIIQNGHLADFLLLTGNSDIQAAGDINASAHVSGTLNRPQGNINLAIAAAHYRQEQISSAQLSASLSDQLIQLTSLIVTAPAGTLKAQASFFHRSGDLNYGTIQAEVSTTLLDLSKSGTLQSARAGFAGNAEMSLAAAGEISRRAGAFVWSVTNLNGDFKATGLRDSQENFGDLTASVHSRGQDAIVSLASSLANSATQLRGSVRLAGDFPFAADLSVSHLALEKIFALAHLNLPIKGNTSLSAHLDGTPRDPRAKLNFQLTRAEMFGQRVDQLTVAGDYSNTMLVVSSLQMTTPAGRADASGSFSHPQFSFADGRLAFHIAIRQANLARLSYLENFRSGLSGTASLTADGLTELNHFQVTPIRFTAEGTIHDVALNHQPMGSLEVKAQTNNKILNVTFQSNLSTGSIRGDADIALSGDFVTHAQLGVNNLTYAAIKPFLSTSQLLLEASLDANARFDGPLKAPGEATAQLQVTKLDVSATSGISFKNDRPIVLNLVHGTIQIASARISGSSMDLVISGSVPLRRASSIDIDVNANADLAVIKTLFPGSVAAGVANAKVSVRGTLASPVLGGRIQLSDGSLQLADWPNGLYKANMVILLTGSGGQIQSLTAESGGGKVSATGFFSISGSRLSYNFQADAHQVRTRYSGVSVTANAALRLSGTGRSGLLSGTVTISRVGYGQQSDIGSILSAATKPPAPPSSSSGVLSFIRASVRIQTAPDALFQTTLAQQLSATANLDLLGSLANPGMLGRITINSGTLIFFANKYSVNHGTISFYDPTSIQPVLDIDLETVAQGVDVNLTVAGPMDNLKLSYRSDPPLKFEDIVALLAAGKTPPDPTIASNQPAAPDQSAMEMGESALVGAAVANPVASRLQRVFGVSQLTIAPTFVSGTALPQARITLQQQVTQNVTFTYSQDVSQANSELVRIEWELAPQFSAVATRDENGVFSVDFFWKKQFR